MLIKELKGKISELIDLFVKDLKVGDKLKALDDIFYDNYHSFFAIKKGTKVKIVEIENNLIPIKISYSNKTYWLELSDLFQFEKVQK